MATTNGSKAGGSGKNGASATSSIGSKTGGGGRRTRSKANGAANETTENGNNAVELEGIMAEQKEANGGTKAGKLELATKPEAQKSDAQQPEESGMVLRSEGEIEVVESYSEAGVRPIAASHMEVYGTILNNRPIMASHLQVVEYAGSRPIFASEMVICDDLTLPGGRPIMASDPRLMEASLITGGRPIASNDTVDGELMMGYLD
jgi:hypothetical protein